MAEAVRMKVYGAWLYQVPIGEDKVSKIEKLPGGVPGDNWKLIRMCPGRFTSAPPGMSPLTDEVLLLGQGDHMIAITSEA